MCIPETPFTTWITDCLNISISEKTNLGTKGSTTQPLAHYLAYRIFVNGAALLHEKYWILSAVICCQILPYIQKHYIQSNFMQSTFQLLVYSNLHLVFNCILYVVSLSSKIIKIIKIISNQEFDRYWMPDLVCSTSHFSSLLLAQFAPYIVKLARNCHQTQRADSRSHNFPLHPLQIGLNWCLSI